MSRLDAQDLFSSGPHTIKPGAWQRSLERRSFPGINGELVLDLGLRARTVTQSGWLQAASAEELAEKMSAVEVYLDGRTHTLVDSHGLIYQKMILEAFEPTSPIRRSRGFWCEYTCRYLQLP
ncbi:MAG: hypothetical protein EHM48_07420 [Planctomycetaceae bacterium]|nr:MAG: hypothetical protein EHM48_07420 [Planctomycetaceae bacterium]